jgi:hypothetical protein
MTAGGGSAGSQADLATMLAEMDSRLQQLQRELEEVAVPITRRGVQSHGSGRPVLEPTGSSSAHVEQELEELQVRSGQATPSPAPAAAPPRSRRPVTRAPRSVAPAPAPPAAPTSSAAPPAPPAAETPPVADPPPEPRPRARRITAVAGERPALPAARPPAAAAPAPSPDALVRDTILEAEEEARRIVEDARARIAAIGARTRAQLEQSLAPPADPAVAAAPAPARPAARPPLSAEDRAYEGAVTVEAGPFDDVAQLKAFEDALGSVPGVEDVYIRTFERYYAHFELQIAQPTMLIAELRARTADPLRVIDATGQVPRLEIVREGSPTAG